MAGGPRMVEADGRTATMLPGGTRIVVAGSRTATEAGDADLLVLLLLLLGRDRRLPFGGIRAYLQCGYEARGRGEPKRAVYIYVCDRDPSHWNELNTAVRNAIM